MWRMRRFTYKKVVPLIANTKKHRNKSAAVFLLFICVHLRIIFPDLQEVLIGRLEVFCRV